VSDFRDVLSGLAAVFERERIDYMVIGGLAVSLWGTQRSTMDVDITVVTDPRDVTRLLEALRPQIKDIAPDAATLVADTGVIRFRHRSGIPVDLGVSEHPYVISAVARAVTVDVQGVDVKFCTAEDLILHKVLADRDRDREDVKGILQRRGAELDRGYLDPLVKEVAEAIQRPELETRYHALLAATRS
jgi:predicted nucleotidyltransferase